MPEKKTPRAYAQAILEIAAEPWLSGLRRVNRRIRERNLMLWLADPTINLEDKKARLLTLGTDIPTQVISFILTLISQGNLNMLDNIVQEFDSLVTKRTSLALGQVVSAVPLGQDERTRLEERLRERFGSELELEYTVDPSIIGGIIVRVGDQVMDGSLATKLTLLREKLVQ
jgi:F-type H+-transporting ATPase subunit delta